MPSLQAFYIEFDRPNAIYAPGEVIRGNVVINLIKQKTIQALNLSAKGEAHVRWSEQISERDFNGKIGTKTVYHTGKEVYFRVSYPIWEKSEGNGTTVCIPAGLSRYPFRTQIPFNVPCSFEHKYGYIRYTIKAIIDRPWRFNQECKAAFTVIAIYDLNSRRERCLSLHDERRKSFCCFNGSMDVQIRIPTTGFVPGQYIEAILDLRNTSNVNVEKISASIEQSSEFYAEGKFHTSRIKKNHESTVAKIQKVGPFAKDAAINVGMYVPPVPPSDLEFCSIIHLRYFLHIIVHVSGFHLNISNKYPILIGTLPLRPDPSAPTFPLPLLTAADFPSASKNEIVPPQFGAGPSAPPNTSFAENYVNASPSYEECCMNKVYSIKEDDESEYVHGANEPFAPRYPVFNFPALHLSGPEK